MRGSSGTERAARRRCQVADRVGTTSRTGRVSACAAAPQIRLDIGLHRRRAGRLLVLERPLLLGAVKLAQVVDARIRLGRGARFDEVRNGDCSEEANDGHDDHDFNQGEA